jgi:transcriptional regulator with XRE-family HTH domain
MRNSVKRHVLARIRLACGLTQKELAKLLEVSTGAIQRIEQGTLALSEELAKKAERQLDLSPEWLLANDPKMSPLSPRYGYWNKNLFEFAQGSRFSVQEKKLSGKPGTFQVNLEHTPPELADKLSAIHEVNCKIAIASLLRAAKGTPRQAILVHRLNRMFEQLRKEFDVDLETAFQTYGAELQQVESAFNEAAKQVSEREAEQLWRKPSREKRKAKPDSA